MQKTVLELYLKKSDYIFKNVARSYSICVFKKGFLRYDQTDIGNNLLLYVVSFRYRYITLHLVFRGDMNHTMKDRENVNFTTRCFI